MKLYSASWNETQDPFNIFSCTQVVDKVEQLQANKGVLILWGGEDISPQIYGERPNRHVYASIPSERDQFEMQLIKRAIELDMPIIGVCRGAQLLCAMAGGKLAQHIEGHGRSHAVTLHDEGDVVLTCNSSHHQMMLPPSNAKILASSEGTVGVNQFNQIVRHDRVNEVVYFPLVKGLGIQPHPEWDNCPRDFVDYCTRKIKEYLV